MISQAFEFGRSAERATGSGQRDWMTDSQVRQSLAALARAGGTPGAVSAGDLRVVPVRFPAEQYNTLKHWCTQHNFPMAVVVRGLVERFLEDQGAQPPPAA